MPPRGPRFPLNLPGPATDAAVPSPASTSPDPATLPELIVEWMPNAAPNAADGTWVSMSPYVVEGSTTRGRKYELDQFGAGTLTLKLQTFDRTFDPEYTAGPYYGQLTPMRQIRVRFKWQGVFYPVWRGYVTWWGQTTVADKMFETTITARDAFERLEQIKLPSSAWALEVQKDNPTCWMRLGETGTSRVTDSSAGGNYGVFDNAVQGAQGLIVNDSDGAAQFAHSLEERVTVQNPALISGYPFTVSMVIKIDSSDPNGFKVIFANLLHPPLGVRGAGGGGIEIAMANNAGIGYQGLVYASVSDGTNKRSMYFGHAPLHDALPHLLHLVCSSSSSMTCYVDGVDVTVASETDTVTWTAPTGNYTLGNYIDLAQGDFGFGTTDVAAVTATNPFPVKERGTIDEFTVYNGVVLAADRIAAQAAAALGWDGDDTGARVSRFLDAINWPSTLRDIETGISVLQAASWSLGGSALSVLQGWADTELGQFFMARDGKLTWRSRHHPFLNTNATRSRATFGDVSSTAPIKIEDGGLVPVRDATQIRNPVSASRANGVTVVVRDDTLADGTYGDRTYQAPGTQDQKDSAVRDRAFWLLARYKQEHLRVESMRLAMRQQPAYWSTVLDLEIGDRFTLLRTPLGIGAQINVDQIIEAIDWQFTAFDMVPTFAGSPVDPNVGNYLILDDAVSGLLDTAVLGY